MRDRLINLLVWFGIFLSGSGIASIVVATRVHGHDPLTHLADSWSGAKSKSGTLCCNGNDYTIIHNWRRTEKGFEVMLTKGEWTKIPPEAVVANMTNQSLEAKIWITFEEGEMWIRCFAPGAEV